MLRFELKQEDINNRCVEDDENCPMAIAMNRYMKDNFYVTVNKINVNIRSRFLGHWTNVVHTVRTPLSIASFIREFDKGEKVTPSWHEIDIPSQYLQEKP